MCTKCCVDYCYYNRNTAVSRVFGDDEDRCCSGPVQKNVADTQPPVLCVRVSNGGITQYTIEGR